MIVTFPDRNFPHITVEFDTDTYTAEYVFDDGDRRPCCLKRQEWVGRIFAWEIDLPALMRRQECHIDEGL